MGALRNSGNSETFGVFGAPLRTLFVSNGGEFMLSKGKCARKTPESDIFVSNGEFFLYFEREVHLVSPRGEPGHSDIRRAGKLIVPIRIKEALGIHIEPTDEIGGDLMDDGHHLGLHYNARIGQNIGELNEHSQEVLGSVYLREKGVGLLFSNLSILDSLEAI